MKGKFVSVLILMNFWSGALAEQPESDTAETDALEEISLLSVRLQALRAELESRDSLSTEDIVDLSGEELSTIENGGVPASVVVKPWYQNVDVSGFGAVWLVDSGRDGTRPDAGFVIKESTLFIEAEAWENVSFFFELQTTLLQRDHNKDVRTAELYAHFRNVLSRWG